MRKLKPTFILFVMITGSLFSFVPRYHGARMLSLGYASSAFNYDLNTIFTNPALVANITASLSGYQYQHRYAGYGDFVDLLDGVLAYDLGNFSSLSARDRDEAFTGLRDLYNSRFGLDGFKASIPGFVSKGYGLAVSIVSAAIVDPVANPILEKPVEAVTDDDIASLQMNLLGLKYTQISMSYGLPVSQGINIGVSLHYMIGKLTEFRSSILDPVFRTDSGASHYLKHAWSAADSKFNKLNVDVGLVADIGQYFKVGIVGRNIGNPTFITEQREIELERRITAGVAFRSPTMWGVYLDVDINESDLYLNGDKVRLASLGVEKGFFANKLIIRAGLSSDVSEEYIFGSRSNSLYGLGVGFNMGRILIDFGMGLDNKGGISSLAVSGFVKFQ
jgi:hypothetical protein